MNPAFTRVFEKEFVSYLHFISVTKLVSNPSVFQSLIESSEIRWTPDFGTWPESLSEIQYINPYQKIEAGFYDEGLGFKLHFPTTIIGYISNEDYVAYYNLDFKDGPDSLIFECSAGNLQVSGGSIEFILDSLNGISIGLYPIPHTTGWDDYETFRFPINTSFEGIHKIYFVFKGDHLWDLMNLKSIQFKTSGINSIVDKPSFSDETLTIYPNPSTDNITVQLKENATLEIFNILGEFLLGRQLYADKNTISIRDLSSGNYIVKISNDRKVISKILIVE